jgi:hypothetical protein
MACTSCGAPEHNARAHYESDVIPPERLLRPDRNSRARPVRAATVNMGRGMKEAVALGSRLMPYPVWGEEQRPRTRADCLPGGPNAQRPCPYVSCHHHLYLDVAKRGQAIKYNFPDLEPDEMKQSCSLDVADGGRASLQAVAELMNVVRERVRQLEDVIAARLRIGGQGRKLRELLDAAE